jgi:chromosome segregation protein
LSQIGVVAQNDGPRLRADLRTGQRLVSQDGALWRWDGYTVRPEAPTPAASRLKQRNRLAALEGEITEAEAKQSAAAAGIAAATANREQAAAQAEAARRASDEAAEAHNHARDHQTELATEAAAQVSRLEALNDAVQRIGGEITECETDNATATAELEVMPSLDAGRADLAAKREALAVARGALEEKSRTHDGIAREASARAARLEALGREQQSWTVRTDGATSRLAELAERQSTVESEQAGLADRPGEIAEQRRALLDEIERAEADRRAAADALATGETMLESRETTLKNVERALASARESMVREEGILEQARQAVGATASQIRERLECQPHEALALADPKDAASLPSAEAMDTRIQRLTRERENIGPVNLRAEAEATEIEEQINMLVTEREDLEAAIARLRQGISSLNREGRERILAAFGEIDGHFQELFTKLFGGGYAHLQMVGSDDPLEAGLEIMASPPGKKLQALSLFSGGEKALTATALIFAAVLTNPAPICVLDEVDAPLDDSNVGRFCEMVSDLAKSTNTRFIVITHHRMTMARVDRLFGVTMAERGVSQLVSVDLDEADRWRQTA